MREGGRNAAEGFKYADCRRDGLCGLEYADWREMKARGQQRQPLTSAVMERKPAYGMPTVPGTPGKARPVSKRTAAGGLGVVAGAAV